MFVCVDCNAILDKAEAAYDVDQRPDGERGTRCRKCAAEFENWAQAWPRREVA